MDQKRKLRIVVETEGKKKQRKDPNARPSIEPEVKEVKQEKLKRKDNETNPEQSSTDNINAKTHLKEVEQKKREKQDRFSWKLKKWKLTFDITHNALSSLLKILTEEVDDLSFLPKTAETFMETPRNIVPEKIIDGDYHYFKLSENIVRILDRVDNLPDQIDLAMGFDAAPLTKSGKKEFTPIMVGFTNIPEKRHSVFTAALYCSEKTLENPKEIFKDFVPDLNKIHKKGLTIQGKLRKIKMCSYCMDAPAKAKATGTKGHTGFSSCSRCWVIGKTIGNRRAFLAQDVEARRHSEWVTEEDDSFHQGYNCLAGIDDINFEEELVLDSLHLSCQGVQKRLLRDFWVEGNHLNKFAKLSSRCIELISARLKLLSEKKYLPREFSNYPRGLEYVCKLKAKEFRSFYLYVGLIVMQFILDDAAYKNFLRFHISFTILLSSILCKPGNIAIAKEQLRIFVEEFAALYGDTYVSYNIHALIHVADDALRHGPLDNIAAWRMENHLGKTVSMTHKPSDAVQQVIRRTHEWNAFEALPVPAGCESSSDCKPNQPVFRSKHREGPLTPGLTDPQYKLVELPQFTFSLRRFGDRCFLSRSGQIVLIENLATAADGKEKIIGKVFEARKSFYTEPLHSSDFGIWEVSQLSKELLSWNTDDVYLKLVILPKFPNPKEKKEMKGDEDTKEIFVIFPMVHCEV